MSGLGCWTQGQMSMLLNVFRVGTICSGSEGDHGRSGGRPLPPQHGQRAARTQRNHTLALFFHSLIIGCNGAYGTETILHAEFMLTTLKGFLLICQRLKIAVNVISQTGGDAKQYQR